MSSECYCGPPVFSKGAAWQMCSECLSAACQFGEPCKAGRDRIHPFYPAPDLPRRNPVAVFWSRWKWTTTACILIITANTICVLRWHDWRIPLFTVLGISYAVWEYRRGRR